MSYVGRQLRERRVFFSHEGGALIVPLDHGLTLGPIQGMRSTNDLAEWIGSRHIGAVLGHKGLIERLILRDMLHPNTGVIVHLNGMPNLASTTDTKVMVASIESALRLGADAVSLQVNFTHDNFAHNFVMLGEVTDAAHAVGLPVLTMLYDKVRSPTPVERIARIQHLVRAVTELGSDAIKLAFPESARDLVELVSCHGPDVHILFAGGEKMSEETLLSTTRAAMRRGARGLCVGRNVFQHPQPLALLEKLSECLKSEAEVAAELDLA